MILEKRKTRKVRVKDLIIGGENSSIPVQSMTNLPLSMYSETIDQINGLHKAGADLVRVAVKTEKEAEFLPEIIKNVEIPLCADIHFDYRIALKSIDAGISKIRINPGNIGERRRTEEVVNAAKLNGIPIRIGVNGGSVNRKIYPDVTPQALVDSAESHIKILEDLNFEDIVVSIKSSDIFHTIEANKLFSKKYDYPLHVGLTEAGYGRTCLVQSSIAIGHLLLAGIGDTIRVSMTGDPLPEIDAAYDILRSLNYINWGVKIVSCPTCGRTDRSINLLKIAETIEKYLTSQYNSILKEKNKLVKVAVMGCIVNGPGEAAEADFGIAGAGNGQFLLFKKGEKINTIDANAIEKNLEILMQEFLV